MNDLQLLDKELNGSLGRMKNQIAAVSNNRRYSEEYVEEFKGKQLADLKMIVGQDRAQRRAKAKQMRQAAKDHYLLESIDHFDVKEDQLYRDFVAASPTDTLVEIAKTPCELSTEKLLVLGGELRRRGNEMEADILATLRPPSAEPWTESEEWKKADLLMADIEACETIERAAKEMPDGILTVATYVMTSDGPQPIDLLL